MNKLFKMFQAAGLLPPPVKQKQATKSGVHAHLPFSMVMAGHDIIGAAPITKDDEAKSPDDVQVINPLTNPDPDATEQVHQIMIDNPDMNAATLINTLKAKGLAIVDQKPKSETNSTSTAIQVTRSQESLKTSVNKLVFLEQDKQVSGTNPISRFKVALIQEGLGNLRDAFYYTREALESAVSAFEGKKCYADHPSKTEEIDRPERTVRDIIGHYENCHIEENKDGSSLLCAELVIPANESFDWARSLLVHGLNYSTKYPDKDFIGLSINASGDAQPANIADFIKQSDVPMSAKPKLMKAIEMGVTQIRIVNAIQDAVSTDMVTEAGAKGRIISLLEHNKEIEMKLKKKESGVLPKEDEAKKEALFGKPAPSDANKGENKDDSSSKKEDESLPAPSADGSDGDHADADADKALILAMIKKYMAGQEDPEADDKEDESKQSEGESEDEACMKAYQGYKEMGYDHEGSMKQAAHAMKLAKHLAGKQSESESKQNESEKKEDESKQSESEAKEDESKQSESEKKEDESESKKESYSKLVARNTFLEKEIKDLKFKISLDQKLQESKLPRTATDKIRALGPKNEAELARDIKVFTEAFGIVAGSESKSKNIFMTSVEKQTTASASEKKFSFADCKK